MATSSAKPYKVEYAKSGRSSCKRCKENIPNKELRIARLIQSRFHDGMDVHWYHLDCLFITVMPASPEVIDNLDELRWDDQELIRNKFGSAGEGTAASGGKKRKRASIGASSKNGKDDAYGDYGVEYAKTGRAACIACERNIAHKEVRIWKLDNSAEKLTMTGGIPVPRQHHVDCFVAVGIELGFPGVISKVKGFKDLLPEDQQMLENKFKNLESENLKRKSSATIENATPAKVRKTSAPTVNTDLLQKQNATMFKIRDLLVIKLHRKVVIRKMDLEEMLRSNGQDPDGSEELKLTRLADVMTFGALLPCKLCKGQLVFKSGVGYECSGYISAHTKCKDVTLNPERRAFVIPDYLKEPMKGYRFKRCSDRVFIPCSEESLKAEKNGGFVKVKVTTLRGWKFIVSTVMRTNTKNMLEDIVTKFNGEVFSEAEIGPRISIVVSTNAEVKRNPGVIADAQKHDIMVVSKGFLETFAVHKDFVKHLKEHLISGWTVVDSLKERVETLNGGALQPSTSRKSKEQKLELTLEKEPEQVKLQLKNGGVVDPDCSVAHKTHVYRKGKVMYSVVLKKTDIDSNVNSYYKMQVLEGDEEREYYVFRSWGRIGTVIGGNKLEEFPVLRDALTNFKYQFTEKTGNEFGKPFVMKPGLFMLLDVTYDEPAEQKLDVSKNSKLPLAVQNLVCLIFDVKRMLSTLLEFEIDTGKMPLGKISRDQILKAFSLLQNLTQTLEKSGTDKIERQLIDYSNQFFSLIPHNLGLGVIPVLKDKEMVHEKVLMLEQLLEIELAYDIIRNQTGSKDNAVDDYYANLKANIHPLEMHSVDFTIIRTYLENTHADTHNQYRLNIVHAYKVDRNGEQERFGPFSKLGNHQLLWHGSRTTNFAGILSQGLRIAPPEAPVTGYMFGKGIYFADMVSKSANYCYPSSTSTTGLLLLCQVALGESKPLSSADDSLTKAPKGFNSVLGVGQTHPDPKTFTTIGEGVKVPYGRPVKTGVNTHLLYNEYIVYDVAQVQIRYILNVEFDYKRRSKK